MKGVDNNLSNAMQKIWGEEIKRQLDDGMKWYSIYGSPKEDTRTRYQKWRDKTKRNFWRKMHNIVEKHNGCDSYYY